MQEFEEFVEEIVDDSEEIEILSDEELEDTTGGAGSFTRSARCLGTINNTTRNKSVWIGIVNRGILSIKKVVRVGGVDCAWSGGAAVFTVKRKAMGTTKLRVYGQDGDWINVNVTFKV